MTLSIIDAVSITLFLWTFALSVARATTPTHHPKPQLTYVIPRR